MVFLEKEEGEEEKKRKDKERKKEEIEKRPDVQDKKERIEKGMEKDMKYGELKTLTNVEYPEFKGILDTGQLFTKREPVIKETSAVRLAEEEKERQEELKERKEKERQEELKERKEKETKEKEREIKEKALSERKEAGETLVSPREQERKKEKELRERKRREREFIQREARKRAMKEKRDIKKIAEELRKKGMITSIRSRMVSHSRRSQKKLKLIKKLLNKIKTRMK